MTELWPIGHNRIRVFYFLLFVFGHNARLHFIQPRPSRIFFFLTLHLSSHSGVLAPRSKFHSPLVLLLLPHTPTLFLKSCSFLLPQFGPISDFLFLNFGRPFAEICRQPSGVCASEWWSESGTMWADLVKSGDGGLGFDMGGV